MRAAPRVEEPETADAAEASWHPGTVLVFFFAASLISAVFFGLGYSFGHHGTTGPEIGYGSVSAAGGLQASRHIRGAVRPASAVHLHRSGATSAQAATLAATRSVGTDGGRFMVQVGAVRNRREARRLVAKLRKSGFQAEIYPGRHDHRLHVEIGPFRTSEEANRMRHSVKARGYRAVLRRA